MIIICEVINGQRVRVVEIDKDGWLGICTDDDLCVGMDCWRDHNGHRECSARCSAFQICSHGGRAFARCRAIRSNDGVEREVLGVFRTDAAFMDAHFTEVQP